MAVSIIERFVGTSEDSSTTSGLVGHINMNSSHRCTQTMQWQYIMQQGIVTGTIILFTGVPALSIPVRLSSNQLPLSIQLVAKHFDERTLINTGHYLEQMFQFHRLRSAGVSSSQNKADTKSWWYRKGFRSLLDMTDVKSSCHLCKLKTRLILKLWLMLQLLLKAQSYFSVKAHLFTLQTVSHDCTQRTWSNLLIWHGATLGNWSLQDYTTLDNLTGLTNCWDPYVSFYENFLTDCGDGYLKCYYNGSIHWCTDCNCYNYLCYYCYIWYIYIIIIITYIIIVKYIYIIIYIVIFYTLLLCILLIYIILNRLQFTWPKLFGQVSYLGEICSGSSRGGVTVWTKFCFFQ